MSPAAATTGSDPLVGPGTGTVDGLAVGVALADGVELRDGAGLADRVGLGDPDGVGSAVVPEGVGVAVTQCGFRGFGRWQGTPWTEPGELTDTATEATTRTAAPPPISLAVLFRRR